MLPFKMGEREAIAMDTGPAFKHIWLDGDVQVKAVVGEYHSIVGKFFVSLIALQVFSSWNNFPHPYP